MGFRGKVDGLEFREIGYEKKTSIYRVTTV